MYHPPEASGHQSLQPMGVRSLTSRHQLLQPMGVRGLVPAVCCHGSAPLAREVLRSNFFFATPVEPALCNVTRGAVTPTAHFDFGFGFDLPAAWSKRVLLGTPVVADGVPR